MKHLHCTRVCGGHQGYKHEWDSQRGLGCTRDYQTFLSLVIFLQKNKSPICKTVSSWAAPNWNRLCVEGEGRAGRMGASSGGYLRKFHGFPEHVWKHWHGWRFRCLCDRDVRFLWFKHRAHYERGGLWGIKNEETVQISECPPWRMLIGFLGSQEFVCRQEMIVMYICYSACISCRIKLLPLVLLYF